MDAIVQQAQSEPQWMTWLRVIYYGLKIAEAISENLTEKRWDSNVQRYRYADGTFAPD